MNTNNKGNRRRRVFLYFFQQRRCYWCGWECVDPATDGVNVKPDSLTRDHILPAHTGEELSGQWWNIIGACSRCNNVRNRIERHRGIYSWRPEDLRFARLTGIDPTGGILTEWLQKASRQRPQDAPIGKWAGYPTTQNEDGAGSVDPASLAACL